MKKDTHEIKDVGYIPMAKKELYALLSGASMDEMENLQDVDLAGVRKSALWEKPKVDPNDPLEVSYYKHLIWTGLNDIPAKKDRDSVLRYIETVRDLKEKSSLIHKDEDINSFFNETILPRYYTRQTAWYVTPTASADVSFKSTFLKNVQKKALVCLREAKKKGFGKTAEEKRKNAYSVFPFGGPVSYDKEKNCIVCSIFHSSSYYYDFLDRVDLSKVTDGDYILTDHSHAVLFVGSKEDAEKMRDMLAERDKKKVSRKSKFVYPGRQSFARTGHDYISDLHHSSDGQMSLFSENNVVGQDFTDVFHIPAVQYGNYMTDKERQVHLDSCFNALNDLADILKINVADISLDSRLGLAFGARGQSAAAAHYEPGYKCINLTKKNGAGCLAHEWGHAFDNYLGNKILGQDRFLSENYFKPNIPVEVKDLVMSLMRQDGKVTDFYVGSQKFDKIHTKNGLGYWASTTEMFARAFDCYIHDKLAKRNQVSDYLSGYSESFVEGEIAAIPLGKERTVINENFDRLFDFYRNMVKEGEKNE